MKNYNFRKRNIINDDDEDENPNQNVVKTPFNDIKNWNNKKAKKDDNSSDDDDSDYKISNDLDSSESDFVADDEDDKELSEDDLLQKLFSNVENHERDLLKNKYDEFITKEIKMPNTIDILRLNVGSELRHGLLLDLLNFKDYATNAERHYHRKKFLEKYNSALNKNNVNENQTDNVKNLFYSGKIDGLDVNTINDSHIFKTEELKNKFVLWINEELALPYEDTILELPFEQNIINKLLTQLKICSDIYEKDRMTKSFIFERKKLYKMYQDVINNNIIDFNEADEIDSLHIKKYKDMIYKSNYSNELKELLLEKWKYMYNLSNSDDTAIKLNQWFGYVFRLPTQYKKLNLENPKELLQTAIKNFDEKIYGMKNVKVDLLGFLASKISNPKSSKNCLALLGPPGVGKTEICKTLSDSMGLPFAQISLGGANDSTYLDGHSFTYIGAEPGIIVKSIIQMGYKNGIIYIDEIDKIAKDNGLNGSNIDGLLHHILDFTQNHCFVDKYLNEIPIDLSGYIFILSMNDDKQLSSSLKDRLSIIKVEGYSLNDKINIVNNFFVPQACRNVNLTEFKLKNEIVQLIINKYDEPYEKTGVRNIKNVIEHLVRNINLQMLLGNFNVDINNLSWGQVEKLLETKVKIDMMSEEARRMYG